MNEPAAAANAFVIMAKNCSQRNINNGNKRKKEGDIMDLLFTVRAASADAATNAFSVQ